MKDFDSLFGEMISLCLCFDKIIEEAKPLSVRNQELLDGLFNKIVEAAKPFNKMIEAAKPLSVCNQELEHEITGAEGAEEILEEVEKIKQNGID